MKLIIKDTKKYGRGVFSEEDIPKDSIVHTAPLIIIPVKDTKNISKTVLTHYVFGFGDGLAIAGGLGSFFNHSKRNNVTWYFEDTKIIFISTRFVKKGSQLFINYGYDPTAVD